MTNSGAIQLYNMPEISNIQTGAKNECDGIRLKTQLTGLNQESFALSWNRE